ncbi:MAG: DUF1573 domain-containing protein [Flavobacteriales bacterium]
MKLLFSILLLLPGVSAFAQNESDSMAAVMHFDSTVVDYGTIKVGSDEYRSIRFTNTGKSPLVIVMCNSSGSDIMISSYSSEAIAPGKTGEITVRKSTGRPGKFNRMITIISNNSSGNIYLKIRGVIIE